jgi:hypothetical protein
MANLSITERSAFDKEAAASKGMSSSDARIHRQISLAEKLNVAYTSKVSTDRQIKESNMEQLQFIIDNPTLCNLFRDHLRDNFCEENLAFWLEVQGFKCKFNITSTASSAAFQQSPPERPPGGKEITPGQQVMEQHHESFIQQVYSIYMTYLSPSSHSELTTE